MPSTSDAAADDDYDGTYVSPFHLVSFLFSELEIAASASKYAELCAQIIEQHEHLDRNQVAALADAIRRGFKKKRGRPKLSSRDRWLQFMFQFGRKLGGFSDVPRKHAITVIKKRFPELNEETAGKVYDRGRRAHKKLFKDWENPGKGQ